MATYTEIFIDQGSDYTFNIDLDKTLDLTGYTAVGQAKKCYGYGSNNTVNFDIIIQNGIDPELIATLTSATTAQMVEGRYTYNIEIISGDPTPIVTRVLEGIIYVTGSIL